MKWASPNSNQRVTNRERRKRKENKLVRNCKGMRVGKVIRREIGRRKRARAPRAVFVGGGGGDEGCRVLGVGGHNAFERRLLLLRWVRVCWPTPTPPPTPTPKRAALLGGSVALPATAATSARRRGCSGSDIRNAAVSWSTLVTLMGELSELMLSTSSSSSPTTLPLSDEVDVFRVQKYFKIHFFVDYVRRTSIYIPFKKLTRIFKFLTLVLLVIN